VAVALIGTVATDGVLYIESSQDGGTVVNSVPFPVDDTTFDLPHIWNVVEQYIRIRYVNGTTAQTGAFQIQAKYSNAQNMGLLHKASDIIEGATELQIVKAVLTGEQLDGSLDHTGGYSDVELLENGAIKTAIPPTTLWQVKRPTEDTIPSGATVTIDLVLNTEPNVLDSGWLPVKSYGGGSLINIITDTALEVYVMNSSDTIGSNIQGDTAPILLPQAGTSATVGAAFFDDYFRVLVVNTSGSSADEYSIRAVGSQTAVTPVFSSIDQPVYDFFPAPLSRSVIVARSPSGVYNNVPADTEGNLYVNLKRPSTAFGDMRTAELTPQVQVQFPYNINTDIVNVDTVSGGTITQADSMAQLKTSTNAAGSAILTSRKIVHYRSGLGALVRYTACYTAGVADSTQMAGVGDGNDGFFFGFDGTDFGVCILQDGSSTWVAQSSWNVDTLDGSADSGNPSHMALGQTKLNVFEINFQWLGAGQIEFLVEDPNTGAFTSVHRCTYANANTVPSIYNPSLPLYLGVTNSGNTSDLTLKSASLGGFVEGKSIMTGPIRAIENTKSHSAERALFSIRNKATYASVTNRVSSFLLSLSAGNDVNKIATFRIWKDATLGGSPSWSDIDTTNSPMESDIAGTTVTGGKLMFAGVVGKDNGQTFDLSKMEIDCRPNEMLTFTSEAGAAEDMSAAVIWREDF